LRARARARASGISVDHAYSRRVLKFIQSISGAEIYLLLPDGKFADTIDDRVEFTFSISSIPRVCLICTYEWAPDFFALFHLPSNLAIVPRFLATLPRIFIFPRFHLIRAVIIQPGSQSPAAALASK
jgi:hypothetical protein